jgi:hypothetical protein
MIRPMVSRLETINPVHFVRIAVISSEILTLLLSIAIGLTLWGRVSDKVLLVWL